MPGQGKKVAIGVLVRSFLDLLAAVDGLDENIVSYSRMDKNPRLSGDRDCILRVTGPRPVVGLMDAAAEVTPVVIRGFVVQLRSRLALDVSDRNDQWLLYEPTEEDPGIFGHSVLEDRIIAAVVPWRPVDDGGDVIVCWPVLLADGTEFRDELARVPTGGGEGDPTWGSSTLTFAVPYMVHSQDLPQAYGRQ